VINQSLINFYVAEVISTDNTYNQTGELYSIDVLVNINSNTKTLYRLKPANTNIKQLPIKGENVLIFQGYNRNSNYSTKERQWYYITNISIQDNINNNILPIYSKQFTEDLEYKDVAIAPLQPYRGDLIFEGRWGNTIRLGSTNINSNSYTIQSPWLGKIQSDPIIIISNGQVTPSDTKFTVEDINKDASSIYLTSKQKIPNLLLGSSNTPNSLKNFYPNESQFSESQFIGIADRVLLKAKTDIAIIDSPKAIILNTTGDVKIGNDNANSSLVHGDVLIKILQKIINQLQTPIQCGTMTGTFLNTTPISSAQQELKNLLSSKYFINKQTY